VTVAVRLEPDALAATVTVIEPLPLPVAGETVAHPASEAAVHEQPLGPFMFTVVVPPLAPTLAIRGETVNAQATPACVRVTV
jgi:hypothetical protein